MVHAAPTYAINATQAHGHDSPPRGQEPTFEFVLFSGTHNLLHNWSGSSRLQGSLAQMAGACRQIKQYIKVRVGAHTAHSHPRTCNRA